MDMMGLDVVKFIKKEDTNWNKFDYIFYNVMDICDVTYEYL
jgi:hypothetical protein